MRPKRVILVIDPNETRRSATAFVLETNGRIALTAPSVYAAAELARQQCGIDLLLGFSPISEDYLTEVAAELRLHFLLIQPTVGCDKRTFWPDMSHILAMIAVALARKRGPRKGTRYMRRQEVA